MKKLIAAIAIVPMIAVGATSEASEEARPQAELTPPAKEFLEKLVNEKFQDMRLYRIESGALNPLHHKRDSTLLHTGSCPEEGGRRGDLGISVSFDKPFTEKPKVLVSLNWIDHVIDGWKGTKVNNNLRIAVEVVENSVTVDGFKYNFFTYCNTAIAYARASWIAYGR